MANSLEAAVRYMINKNNHSLNIAFPALVVGVQKISDGFIDVKPLVNHTNPLTMDYAEYPTLYDIPVVFPSTKNSTFCFPINQGDFVDLLIQSVDVQRFVEGEKESHDPNFLSFGNLANCVAIVGFTPYQESCFNPNNYKNEFNNQDLNIVHNKNTDQEAIISVNTQGDIHLKSPTKVLVESKEVQVVSDKIDANNAVISTQGDIEIQGRSVKQFMDLHTHIDGEGKTTSTPQGF